jgi:hypothetical protein
MATRKGGRVDGKQYLPRRFRSPFGLCVFVVEIANIALKLSCQAALHLSSSHFIGANHLSNQDFQSMFRFPNLSWESPHGLSLPAPTGQYVSYSGAIIGYGKHWKDNSKLTQISQVQDLRPASARVNLTDPSSVEKYNMPSAQYEHLPDSVLAWKKSQKLGMDTDSLSLLPPAFHLLHPITTTTRDTPSKHDVIRRTIRPRCASNPVTESRCARHHRLRERHPRWTPLSSRPRLGAPWHSALPRRRA